MALSTQAVHQRLSVVERDEGRVRLKGLSATDSGDVALSLGPGISVRHRSLPDIDGSGGLTWALVDPELADPVNVGLLLGVESSSLAGADAGREVDVSLHPVVPRIARLLGLRAVPHPFHDRRVWSLELALEAEPLRWVGGEFADWIDDLQYDALCLAEDWLDAARPDAIEWQVIAVACRRLCGLVSASSPWAELAEAVDAELGVHVADPSVLVYDEALLSGGRRMSTAPVGERTFAIAWDWLPVGLTQPDDWFASAIRTEIDGDQIRVSLTPADDDGLEQDVLFLRCCADDSGEARWIGTIHRDVTDGTFLGVVYVEGLDDVDDLRVEVVDSLLRPVRSRSERLCVEARQWFEVGSQRARLEPANLERATIAYDRAATLFAAAGSDLAEPARAYAQDPSRDADQFIADQGWSSQ